jgi:DNA-binding MarR family transcriptional regulator
VTDGRPASDMPSAAEIAPSLDVALASEHTADDSPGLLLWQVTNRWQAAIRAVLKPYGLTHVQFVLLASLTWLAGEADGAGRISKTVTQRELADQAATDPMMTSQVLRALEQRSLVSRSAHPVDKRAVAIAVTDSGAGLANSANAAVEACDRQFFGALGARQTAFVTQLRALRAGARSD